jgi:tetratricopeptide (TPR) repeat protein
MATPSPPRRRRRASILVGTADLERLIAECDAALEADPANLHTRAVRGHACVKTKRWAMAVQDFSIILAARPDDEHARFSRGMALFKSAHVDAAHRDFSRVLELNPAHVMARYARAGCYNSEGEFNQAIQEYWLALRHDEENALRVDSRHRIGWASGESTVVVAAPAAAASSATSDGDNCDSKAGRSTEEPRPATVSRTVSACSETAMASLAPARIDPRRAARKVVQVRVNLTQFAVDAGLSSRADAAGSTAATTSRTSTESAEHGVKATTEQSADEPDTSTRATGAARHPAAGDQGAMPPVRAAPRAVRRVTVVL